VSPITFVSGRVSAPSMSCSSAAVGGEAAPSVSLSRSCKLSSIGQASSRRASIRTAAGSASASWTSFEVKGTDSPALSFPPAAVGLVR